MRLVKDAQQFRNQLIDVLRTYFNSEELKLLYFRLFGEVPEQNSKALLILGIIERTQHHQRIPELVELIKTERPNVDLS